MKTLKIISLLCISIFFLSCKKNDKVETVVDFHLYNPVTNVPFQNVPVYVYKVEGTSYYYEVNSVEEYQNSIIWEGVTDSEGKAQAKFLATDVKKFNYWARPKLSFALGKEIVSSPDLIPLTLRENNSIVYKVVDKVNLVIEVKNINCLNENDKFKFSRKSTAFQGSHVYWYPFQSFGYYEGCYQYTSPSQVFNQDIWEIKSELIRDGVTTYSVDTFYLIGQNGQDTLKIHY